MMRPFVKVTSVAAEGNFGGCEIWLNTSVPIGQHDGHPQFLKPENVSILVAKPRLLIVALRTTCFEARAICMHAPDSSWASCDILQWWKTCFDDLDTAVPQGCTVMCGADLNMRIRRSEMPWIGNVLDGPAGGGVDEVHVHALCKKLQVAVVSTHSQNVDDELRQGTFVPSRSLLARRCDYVLVSFDTAVVPKSAKVDDRFDLHAAADDHLPIVASVLLPVIARHPIVKRRRTPYSRSALQADARLKPSEPSERKIRVEKNIGDWQCHSRR